MLCCVAPCVVVVCSPPNGGACCVGVWPPSWWGVLCTGAVCCVVWRCVVCGGGVWPPSGWGVLRWGAVCCVVWRSVLWWCVATRMVGHVALVCGLPHGGACCGGVWPPSWWGVRRWLVLAGCFWLWRGCCLARSGGPASRARAVRHPVLLFRGSRRPHARFPLFRFLVCVRLLAGCWRVPSFAPLPRGVVPGGCRRRTAALLFSPCLLVSVVGRPQSVAAAGRAPPPPRAGSGFVVACLLLLVAPRLRSVLHLLSSRGFGPPPPPAPLLVCVARMLPPCGSFPLVFALLVCCCALFGLSARVSAGCCPPLPAPHSSVCVSRVALPCPLCSPCLLFLPFCLPFVCAWCCAPPPPVLVSVSRASLPLSLCISACCIGRSGVRCTLLRCAVSCCHSCVVWCCLVLPWTAVCCVVSFGAVWRGGVWCGA